MKDNKKNIYVLKDYNGRFWEIFCHTCAKTAFKHTLRHFCCDRIAHTKFVTPSKVCHT